MNKKTFTVLVSATLILSTTRAEFIITQKDGTETIVDGQAEVIKGDTDDDCTIGGIPVPDIEKITYREAEIAKSFAGGDGTESNPFVIKTRGQLNRLAHLVNNQDNTSENINYASSHYVIDNDIDMSTVPSWTPIGTGAGNDNFQIPENNMFTGSIDGKGHTITGLTIDMKPTGTNTCAGFVGILGTNGSVSNLNIEGIISVSQQSSASAPEMAIGGIAAIVNGATISGCSFIGEIKADLGSCPTGTAIIGGICGYQLSGTISDCKVTLNADKELSVNGSAPQAGGILGFGNSGHLYDCTAEINGNILAIAATTAIADDLPFGIVAHAGGIAGVSFGTSIYNCGVTVSGTIKAEALSPDISGVADAGGIAGNYQADVLSTCTATISGSIRADGSESAKAAGGIASQNGGYGASDISVDITGSVIAETPMDSQVTMASSCAAAGGVYGSYSNPQAGGGITNCNAIIAGTLKASHPNGTFAAGVIGSGVTATRCYAIVSDKGSISATSGNAPAMCGGITGNLITGTIAGCYFISNGTINVTSTTADANFGGILGVGTGSRFARKSVMGCYALLEGGVTVSGETDTCAGGIAGLNNTYLTLTENYWHSASDNINGHSGIMGESSEYRLADTSRSTLETAAEAMNSAIEDKGVYSWSETDSRLVISAPAE